MRILLLPLLFLPALPGPDLDVNAPPGCPLDWHHELSRPIPTGHRGRTPVATEYGKGGGGGGGGGTKAEDRYPKGPVKTPFRPGIDYTVLNAADQFVGTSADSTTHLKWGTPPQTKTDVTQDDVATDGGYVMKWNYPPNFPAELIWTGLAASIREKVHMTAVSWAEMAAFCLEIGEPAILGADLGDGKIKAYLKTYSSKLPPKAPDIPKHKDPKIAILYKLAAVELSGGFPHALDPSFARRTLALGEEAYDAVLECCKSPHPFLARNAVVVLAEYQNDRVKKDLLELWKGSKDPTFRARALRALAARKETAIVQDLIVEASVGDLPRAVMAIYALGYIGDASAAEEILKIVRKNAKKPPGPENVDWAKEDFLWTVIPALGRMKGGKETLIGMESYLRKRFGGRDDTNVADPEPLKIFRQLCLIALAAHGEKAYVDEVVGRVKKSGLGSFHPVTLYFLIETLPSTMEGADALKTKFLDVAAGSASIRLAALESMHRHQRLQAEYLREVALRAKELATVRARATQLLLDYDGPTAREVCIKIVRDYADGSGPTDAGTEMLAATAAQVGGIVDATDVPVLVKSLTRAFGAGAFARREGNNDTNLAQTKISMRPALLETLAIELGRTASPDGLAILKDIFTRRRFPQGRAEAIVAIGAIPGKEADSILVDALTDKDGWVRYCAYRALVKRSGQDHFAGWIWVDDDSAARKAIAAYKEWLKKQP